MGERENPYLRQIESLNTVRRDLLKAGYTPDHPAVKKVDEQIQAALQAWIRSL